MDNPLFNVHPKIYILTISEDPDEIQNNAPMHQGLQYMHTFNQPSGMALHDNLDLKIPMGNPIPIVSVHTGKSTRMQMVYK